MVCAEEDMFLGHTDCKSPVVLVVCCNMAMDNHVSGAQTLADRTACVSAGMADGTRHAGVPRVNEMSRGTEQRPWAGKGKRKYAQGVVPVLAANESVNSAPCLL